VELLGRSALEHYDPAGSWAVMLTGMGYDGADAFAEIKKRGARTIAESEETAVVFGMPAELIERGGANLVLPPNASPISFRCLGGRVEIMDLKKASKHRCG
jgi:two-component system, chemotaxis family, protein-glutamate methylesterase/glutaminase